MASSVNVVRKPSAKERPCGSPRIARNSEEPRPDGKFSDRMSSNAAFLTAGESHGQALVAILEGVPAGLTIDLDVITAELRRRQTGYGRGRRMARINRAEPLSGIRHGVTTARRSPCSFQKRTGRTGSARCTSRQPCRLTRRVRIRHRLPAPVSHADLAGFVSAVTRTCATLEGERARRRPCRGGSIAWQILRGRRPDRQPCRSIGSAAVSDPLAVTFDRVRAIARTRPPAPIRPSSN